MSRLAVSLDGPTAAVHDPFRRVEGSFEPGLRILRTAREVGTTTRVDTVVARHNVHDFRIMAERPAEAGIVFCEVLFLVPVGRARPEDVVGAGAFEEVFNELYDLAPARESHALRRLPYDEKRRLIEIDRHAGRARRPSPPLAARPAAMPVVHRSPLRK